MLVVVAGIGGGFVLLCYGFFVIVFFFFLTAKVKDSGVVFDQTAYQAKFSLCWVS